MDSTQNVVNGSPERVLRTSEGKCPGAPERPTTRTRFESSVPINLFPDIPVTSDDSVTSDASVTSDDSDTSGSSRSSLFPDTH